MAVPQRFSILRVGLPPGDAWSGLAWSGFSAGYVLSGNGVSPADALPDADELEILLPACRVSMHRLELPERAGKHLDALIRQALEDRLLGDRADALAVSGASKGIERRVWVCGRRWLEGALERLAAAGRYADGLVPEYELLPESENATVFAAATGGTIFRTASGQFGIAGNEAAEAVIAQLAGGEALQRAGDIARRPCPPGGRAALPPALARLASRRLDLRPLRATGALLAASIILALLAAVAHWRHLENRAANLQHEIRQTFAAAFPGTPIVDPILQWESKRRESTQTRDDALDAAIGLAARLKIPVKPRGIEASEAGVRLTLTDSDAAQYQSRLEAAGKPEKTPAGPGFTQFLYRPGREQR
ncbi:MAG: hypothetical protein LBI87_01630 [Candidatus Accumulibacter sp.]|jgi:type II secretion system protein L|nr:hypothetical protein [Accumulibacter sp.]